MTILDVAREAGVSAATVSRVLNGSSTVDPELARRVRAAAAATAYVPNSTGRALRRQVSDTWAAIVTDVQNPFFTAMVAALESVAVKQGYSVMLCNSDEQLGRERTYLEAAVSQRMAGVVVAVTSESASDLGPIRAARIPTVVVDRRLRDYLGDTILVDNVRAGELAAEHLIQHGYRRIACIAGPPDVSTTEDRLTGFRAALERAGHPIPDRWVCRANLRAEGGEVAMRSLFNQTEPPDAVFTTNGPLTVGAYRAIQAVGRSIPADVALLGVDDDQWTRMVSPMVSVIQQPVGKMGRLAGELLLARSQGVASEPQHIVLRPELLVRASTGPRT
ncbi:LacI family DNA-binding transcriptional regulator [Cellulomonas sp. KRMCY2]|uniref:LacI family DNA-binding transcriptional regulator n=1 Tax=Cellulomonas sp. KRMCY2 TaxID=1304865 RepID=UPI000558AC52|nr:LacI family DNA-binding transcriptional regulator [Cellulomonas sp. KRMCY2]